MLFFTKLTIEVARISIERSGGLVEDQDVRLAGYRPGDGHPLLLTPAQLHRRQIGARTQPDNLQIFLRFNESVVPGFSS